MEIIAHRGASFDAPENTLAAVQLAWTQGADAAETDVWLSNDGHIVAIHDPNAKRVAKVDRKIAEMSWEEIQTLEVGAWKSPSFAGERIPLLDALIAATPADRRLVVEVKCGPEIASLLARTLTECRRPLRELPVICFEEAVLIAVKQALPAAECYLLHNYRRSPVTGQHPRLEPLMERCLAGGFAGLDLQFEWPIDRALVDTLHSAGLKLMTWTVDDIEVARRFRDLGVDGLTTNRPGWIREQLAR